MWLNVFKVVTFNFDSYLSLPFQTKAKLTGLHSWRLLNRDKYTEETLIGVAKKWAWPPNSGHTGFKFR